jgi:hypothetical protein
MNLETGALYSETTIKLASGAQSGNHLNQLAVPHVNIQNLINAP